MNDPSRRPEAEERRRRRMFALLILIQTLGTAFLILTRRLPKGHDTLSVYLLQYIFQAHALQGSSPLLWMPNLTHGIVSTWFANLQSGPLQSATLLLGGAPAGTSMPLLFYAGLWMEDLILAIGLWHLGGRLYRSSSARFFVAVAGVGSSLWVSNLYWNTRLIYAVPLVCALLIDVLHSGSRWKLFLAVSLGCLQLTGNAVYIPMLSGLTILLFVGLYAGIHRRQLRPAWGLLRPRATDALWLAAIGATVAGVLIAIVPDLGSFRQFHAGRSAAGTVTADAFLTYPGGLSPLRYLDFLFGTTPSSDYSLYCGLCTVVLALLAFVQRPGRNVLHLGLVLVILVLFSTGYLSIVGAASYYAIPPLRYFRYVSLAAPLVRVLVILLAGFGFEAFTDPAARSAAFFKRASIVLAGIALIAAGLAVAHVRGSGDNDPLMDLLESSRLGLAPRTRDYGAYAALTLVALSASFLFAWKARGGTLRVLVPLLLLLQVLDISGWRLRMLLEGTVPLDPSAVAIHRSAPIPYLPRRTLTYADSPRYRAAGDGLFQFGAAYDYADPFLHIDASWSRFFVTQWSPSVDVLLRARAGLPIHSEGGAPPGLPSSVSATRTTPEAFAKAIGESEDKLQVFSHARVAADEDIAALMIRKDYPGDLLLLSPPLPGAATETQLEPFRSAGERLPVVPRVEDFSGDRLRVLVEIPATQPEAWLVYCDAWHPDWRATVDGSPVRVERANLAYKAVRLHAGRNDVEFRLHAPWRAAGARAVGLLWLFWSLVASAWALALLGADDLVRRMLGRPRHAGPMPLP